MRAQRAPGDIPGGEVGFRADNDTWYLVKTAEVDDFVVHDLDHVEGLAGGDGVHEDEAVDANSML